MTSSAGAVKKMGEIRLRGWGLPNLCIKRDEIVDLGAAREHLWNGADAGRARVTLEDINSGKEAGVTGGWIPFDGEGLR
jgi:hypothetical protein